MKLSFYNSRCFRIPTRPKRPSEKKKMKMNLNQHKK